MKIIATILLGIVYTTSQGQITSAGLTPFDISGIAELPNGTHYICSYDVGFLVYDSTFTLIYNVPYPIMLDQAVLFNSGVSSVGADGGVGFISNTLFDTDPSTLEYVYYTHTIQPNPSDGYLIVARIGGGIVFALPQGYAHRAIINTPSGTKWITAYINGNQTVGHVWDLPGILPCPDCDGTVTLLNGGNDHQMETITPLDGPNISYKLYPNPTDGLLNIDLEFPEDVQTATFVIRDQKSVEVKSIVINSSGTHQVNLENVSPGVYVTELVGPNGRIGPGQLVVVE